MATKRPYIMLRLIRCGKTRWAEEGRVGGGTDVPLSDAGRQAVAEAAARLKGAKLPTIYHGPDEAAEATARLFAKAAGGRTKAINDLADPDLGLFEGLRRQEIAERYPKRHKQWEADPLSLVPPEGEPMRDAYERLLEASERVIRKSRAREVAIVLHPVGFTIVRDHLADRPPTDAWTSATDTLPMVERYVIPRAGQ